MEDRKTVNVTLNFGGTEIIGAFELEPALLLLSFLSCGRRAPDSARILLEDEVDRLDEDEEADLPDQDCTCGAAAVCSDCPSDDDSTLSYDEARRRKAVAEACIAEQKAALWDSYVNVIYDHESRRKHVARLLREGYWSRA